MAFVIDDAIGAVAYTIVGGVIGLLFMMLGVYILPKFMDKITPKIDDEKEILKGNLAVGTYFSNIIGAMIIGLSIIIGAAIIGGLL